MCAQSRPRLRRAASPLRLLLETRGSATAAGPVGRAAARRATWSGTAAAGDMERHGGGGAGRGPSPLGARVGGGGAPPAAAGEGHRVARAALRVPASPRMRRAGSGTHVGRPAGPPPAAAGEGRGTARARVDAPAGAAGAAEAAAAAADSEAAAETAEEATLSPPPSAAALVHALLKGW